MSSLGLYAQLLDAQWPQIAEVVRHLHDGRGIRAVGRFRVRHGNRMARMLASLTRLPSESDCVELRLAVTAMTDREQWQRLFAATLFSTLQWANDGHLVERVGASETHLQLEAVNGTLHY